MEAIKNNVYILRYLSDTLKNEKEIVLEAVKNNRYAFRYVS